MHIYKFIFSPSSLCKSVLGTCATISATAPLARTKKGGAHRGGAHRGGANVKNNGVVAVARKKVVLICPISAPFLQGWEFAHSLIRSSLIRSNQMSDCEGFAQIVQDR